jgi:hypothetical protein
LETIASDSGLKGHGNWLTETLDTESRRVCPPSQLNSLILTTTADSSFAPFLPGTVYEVTDETRLIEATGYSAENLKRDCFEKNPDTSPVFEDFRQKTKPVFVEISPVCDFHQKNRRSAMLLAGIICPVDLKGKAKSKDSFKITPVFVDRFSTPIKDVALVLCSNYRLTISPSNHPDWLRPWIRLRETLGMPVNLRVWGIYHSEMGSLSGS